MKIATSRDSKRDRGMAVIAVLALIALLLVCAVANLYALRQLGRDVNLLEKQQLHRQAARSPG